MELKPDWANRQVKGYGTDGAQIVLRVEGLRGVRPEFHAGFYDLGFKAPPLDRDGQPLWEQLDVSFETDTVTVVVGSTSRGTEIRRAIDAQLRTVAQTFTQAETAEEERERVAEQQVRRRQQELDALRADLGN